MTCETVLENSLFVELVGLAYIAPVRGGGGKKEGGQGGGAAAEARAFREHQLH